MAASRPGVERPISRDKARRQLRILELVREENISTQEDLAQRLRQAGLTVTQATVSRDIKELGLLKVTGSDGRQHYESDVRQPSPDEKLMRICRDSVLSIEYSDNMIVMHTLPATADAVCEAIDSLRIPGVIGTMAGERTVFLVVRPAKESAAIVEDLRRLTL